MTDYWISFAVSLNPNDGKGSKREFWYDPGMVKSHLDLGPSWSAYTSKNQAVIQLDSRNVGMIPDDYRKEQIAFLNSDPLLFHH